MENAHNHKKSEYPYKTADETADQINFFFSIHNFRTFD